MAQKKLDLFLGAIFQLFISYLKSHFFIHLGFQKIYL